MTTKVFKESIHILEAGSIGCLFASSIRAKFPNFPVTLLLRKERRQQLGKNAAAIDIQWKSHPSHSSLGNKPISVPVEFLQSDGDDETDSHLPSIRNLVVTTKAYQALPAIQSVLPRLQSNVHSSSDEIHNKSSTPRIILLCNGAVAVKEELQTYFEKSTTRHAIPHVVLATTTHGAYREKDIDQDITKHSTQQSFVHAGYGQTFIEETAQDVATLWNDAGLTCSALSEEAMNALLLKKLAVNCVINPLTALYGCTNGELLLEPSFFEMQHELLEEVAQVAAGAAAAVESNSSPSVNELRQFVQQVIQDTHANKSSMYQDVANGQRTEIDHLNGYIVRKGRQLQMECPANEDICQRIQELQQSKEKS